MLLLSWDCDRGAGRRLLSAPQELHQGAGGPGEGRGWCRGGPPHALGALASTLLFTQVGQDEGQADHERASVCTAGSGDWQARRPMTLPTRHRPGPWWPHDQCQLRTRASFNSHRLFFRHHACKGPIWSHPPGLGPATQREDTSGLELPSSMSPWAVTSPTGLASRPQVGTMPAALPYSPLSLGPRSHVP